MSPEEELRRRELAALNPFADLPTEFPSMSGLSDKWFNNAAVQPRDQLDVTGRERAYGVLAGDSPYNSPRAEVSRKITGHGGDMSLADMNPLSGVAWGMEEAIKNRSPVQGLAAAASAPLPIAKLGMAAVPAAKAGLTKMGEAVKNIIGAPAGVTSPQKERALRDAYLKAMEEGSAQRGWYGDAGQTIRAHVPDELDATKMAGGAAVTSAGTAVDPNVGYAIRAHNQRAMQMPVETGKFPTEMSKSVERVYDAPDPLAAFSALGPKRGPFARNIAVGGEFAPAELGNRPVHDIWDARAHGFQGKEGKPYEGTPGAAQHRWMDEQADKIIAQANRTNLGGTSDWNPLSSQAAAWFGMQKAADRKGGVVSDLFPKYYAQGSYEATPGVTTDHLPGFGRASLAAREDYMDEVVRRGTDQTGRDRIALAFGAPTGPTIRGPGLFEGTVNPGAQAQYAVGRAPGGATIDPASKRLTEGIEATRGILLGQDASAYHVPGNIGSLKASPLADVKTPDNKMSYQQMDDMVKAVRQRFGKGAEDTAFVPTREGFRGLSFMGGDNTGFQKFMRDQTGQMGLPPPTAKLSLGGDLISNDWRKDPLGRKFAGYIRDPVFRDKFDAVAPDLARQLNDLDVQMHGAATGNSQVAKLRHIIANEGYDGLMKAIKAGAPLALVGGVLSSLGMGPAPEREDRDGS